MTVIELLDGLIEDLKDSIDAYTDDIKRTDSKLEKYNYKIRIEELKKFRESLKIIRSEQE